MDKKKIAIISSIVVAVILLVVGVSYAYFSATVTENNKTQTVIKAGELSLTFNGTSEITAGNMIPGDSFTKTFTVENTSNAKISYNIYMEGITNEFNEDLVYVLSDETGTVVAKTPLPTTNAGKTYLLENIEIESGVTKEYTLKIEYTYLDTPQNDYQGAEFKATVGIDSNKVESQTPAEPVALKYFALGLPTTESTTDYTTLGKTVFAALGSDNSLGVCINDGGLFCIKNNDYENSAAALKEHFGDDICSLQTTDLYCVAESFECTADFDGRVSCFEYDTGFGCRVQKDGTVSCFNG